MTQPIPDFNPLTAFPNGTGATYDPETGVLTYYLRGTELEIGNPIYVKSLGQLGVIVSDCACNAGAMHHYMTNTITSDPDNYILPTEPGYGT